MKYRACNNTGSKFVADDHMVAFDGGDPFYVSPEPREPDMYGSLVAFASAEDLGHPQFGTWFLRPSAHDVFRPTGITWRSWWPGRFDPDGTYYISGKKGDLNQSSGRASYWMTKGASTTGPFATGTTNIEGISDFTPDGRGGWTPVWQNRGRPLIVEINRTPYRLPLWTQAGDWLYGQMTGEYGDQHIVKDPSGVWRLVTKRTPPPVFPCVKQQQDGSLLVAWNGDRETFISSHEGWPVLVIAPIEPPVKPPKPPVVKPPIEPPIEPPVEPPTGTRVPFPKMRRFMSETELVVRGLQKQVNWNPNMDGRGHRAIWGSVRPDGGLVNGEGKVRIGDDVSNAPPDAHGPHPEGPQDDGTDDQTEVRLRMRPGEQGVSQLQRIDIQFTHGEHLQLCEMPPGSPDQFGELQTRATDAIDIQEMWNDGILNNTEQVFHLSGGALRVIR